MPAPSAGDILNFYRKALVNAGFTQKEFDDNENIQDTGELTAQGEKLAMSLADGLGDQWDTWQKAQGVAVLAHTPGGPAAGTGPLALP